MAQALADPANLQLLAERYDPNNYGLRDVWETLVLTGRRCTDALQLRLECLTVHRNVPSTRR